MLVSGVGALTSKGLEIADFCKLNDVSLDFKHFYVTDNLSLTLTNLTDPTHSPYNDITDEEFVYNLENVSSTDYYRGSVSTSESLISNGQSVIPILMSIVSNDIEENLDIYTVFISVKDPNGAKITVADGSTFLTTPQTITFGAPFSGTATLDYIDGNDLYISNIQSSLAVKLTYDEFIAEITTSLTVTGGTDGASSLTSSANVDDANYLFYKGCIRYDERLDITVANATNFSAGSTLTNPTGAVASVTNVAGSVLTVNRTNTSIFSNGENVDYNSPYSAPDTTITAIPIVNTTSSVVTAVKYTSDGSDLLLRINLRSTSGFPQDLTFLNTAVTEIEIHNADTSDTHPDIRLQMLVNASIYGSDIRYNYDQIVSLKNQINAIITANGLSGGPIV